MAAAKYLDGVPRGKVAAVRDLWPPEPAEQR
jgi:hypothetical protein